MIKSTAELKAEAKASLKGEWKRAILLNAMPTIVRMIFLLVIVLPILLLAMKTSVGDVWLHSFSTTNTNGNSHLGISFVGSIISALFMSGISWTYLDLIRGTKSKIDPLKDALRGFQSQFLGGVILLALVTSIFVSLWTLLLVIPGVVKAYAYSQSYFIYYDQFNQTNEKPKILETITASRQLMKGYKGKLFWLDLTFIGWHLLSIATFGLGYLWLNPYVSATKAAFYNHLVKEEK